MKEGNGLNAQDVRWMQRCAHFEKALAQLGRFIRKGELNELEEQGLIKSFEYTYELAWTTLKDYFEEQGETGIHGSRDAFRLAFRRGLVEEGEVWMDMVRDRILTVHTYNEDTARMIAKSVVERYYPEFIRLRELFQVLKERVR